MLLNKELRDELELSSEDLSVIVQASIMSSIANVIEGTTLERKRLLVLIRRARELLNNY